MDIKASGGKIWAWAERNKPLLVLLIWVLAFVILPGFFPAYKMD